MVWLGLYEAIDKNGLSTGDNARKPEGYDHVVPPQVKRALNFAFTLGLKDGQNGNEHARDLGVPPGDNDGYAASVLEQYYTAGNAYALKTFTGTINTGSTIHKAAGGTQAAPKVKISPPEPFNGDRTKYDKFATQLSLVFLANPAVYSNDQTRVTYAASYLRGPAADWWVPQMNSATGTLDASVSTYPGFLASLRAAFDDPGALEQVARDLQRLRQGKFTVSEYYAKFLTLSSRLDWTESTLVFHFSKGLNQDIKQALIMIDTPDTISSLAGQAQKADQRIRAMKGEYSSHQHGHQGQTSVPSTTGGPHPDSMDLSSAQRYKVSDKEKERRWAESLCLRCGGKNHQAKNCRAGPPQQNQRQKAPQHERQQNHLSAQRVEEIIDEPEEDVSAPSRQSASSLYTTMGPNA